MSPDPPRPAQSESAVALPQPESAPAGFGYHHHPIHTASREAQQQFDRGMAQAFGFNHEAAIRSFQRASELDPAAAMPHWGRAWALGANYNLDIDDARAKEAYDAITKAKSLAPAGPDVEREYIDALAVRYSPDLKADRPALARTYSNAMGALSQRYLRFALRRSLKAGCGGSLRKKPPGCCPSLVRPRIRSSPIWWSSPFLPAFVRLRRWGSLGNE